MQPIQKAIKRASRWYIQVWDGVSGKDYRRFKQLQLNLAASQQNEAELRQHLTESQNQCAEIQRALAAAEETVVGLRLQLSEANGQRTQLQQVINTSTQQLQQSLATSQQNEAELKRQLAAVENQYADAQKELNELVHYSDSEIQTLETELDAQRSALAYCQTDLGVAMATPPPALETNLAAPLPIDLSEWKIALVGGHEATKRGVGQKLHQNHELRTLVEIPPIHMSQQQLKQKLENCDLIVSIVGYSNHPLTRSVTQLKNRGALKGELLPLNCRGVSGVVREILAFVEDYQNRSPGKTSTP
ncbi:MAG: hypothetical protein AAF282_05055 [Cyanobacteria bacterium P01_A01_bin.15]